MRSPTVCVGVPVWRGADYVAETLQSVLRQRGVRLSVVVSVDGDDQESVAACRPFLLDGRVTLFVQSQRLGWVGNSSAALTAAAGAGTDYACLQPHDDLLDDDYLAVLVATAEANREAAVVYSDIQCFGTYSRVIRQPTVAGSPFARQVDVMNRHYAAVSYRGLMRASALRSILPMAGNPCRDFAADTVWLARQALVGDLVRVPQPLYRKRYHADNTHSQWATWPPEARIMAWTRHCLDMLAEALKATRTASQQATLHNAARRRLLRPRNWTPYRHDLANMPRFEQAAMRSRFDTQAASRTDIGPPPPTRLRAGLRLLGGLSRMRFGRRTSRQP
jgi:glycosyltransferase involved in cell wall biosynthesis